MYICSGFVSHYFPVETQIVYLSRPVFVNVQNWRNSVNKLNITIVFPFYNLFKVQYNTHQRCVRLANWSKEKKKKICLKWIKFVKKTTTHSQNILHVDVLYIIKRKKYNTVCAELAFAKVAFDRMDMICLLRISNVFCICYAVGLLQYSKNGWS